MALVVISTLQLVHTLSQAARFGPALQNPCTLLGGQYPSRQSMLDDLKQRSDRIESTKAALAKTGGAKRDAGVIPDELLYPVQR